MQHLQHLLRLVFHLWTRFQKKLFVHSQNHKKIKSGGSERFLVVQQCGKCCRSSHSHSRSTLRGAKEDHLRSSEWLDGNGIHRSWCGTMRISRSCGSPNHADLRTMRISESCGSKIMRISASCGSKIMRISLPPNSAHLRIFCPLS